MINCPICQKQCIQLTAQHIAKHGITVKDFKEKYPLVDLGNHNTARVLKENAKKHAILENKRCLNCNILIEGVGRKYKRFCSSSCSAIWNNKHREAKQKNCQQCGKSYNTKSQKSKFCSSLCSAESKNIRIKCNCNNCNKEIFVKNYKFKHNKHNFCSNQCKKNYFINNPYLRGTFSGYHNSSKSTSRKRAFESFKNECFYCKYKKHESLLQVHHKDGNRKNNELNNLMILCPTCHGEVHLGIHKL